MFYLSYGKIGHMARACRQPRRENPAFIADSGDDSKPLFIYEVTDFVFVAELEGEATAILDSGCSRTVCGSRWLQNYETLTGTLDNRRVSKNDICYSLLLFRLG